MKNALPLLTSLSVFACVAEGGSISEDELNQSTTKSVLTEASTSIPLSTNETGYVEVTLWASTMIPDTSAQEMLSGSVRAQVNGVADGRVLWNNGEYAPASLSIEPIDPRRSCFFAANFLNGRYNEAEVKNAEVKNCLAGASSKIKWSTEPVTATFGFFVLGGEKGILVIDQLGSRAEKATLSVTFTPNRLLAKEKQLLNGRPIKSGDALVGVLSPRLPAQVFPFNAPEPTLVVGAPCVVTGTKDGMQYWDSKAMELQDWLGQAGAYTLTCSAKSSWEYMPVNGHLKLQALTATSNGVRCRTSKNGSAPASQFETSREDRNQDMEWICPASTKCAFYPEPGYEFCR
jgi:hypothetical protein